MVEKAKQEKRSIVIRAQGEAASAEMIGRSISDKPGFVELRRIDAARDIAQIVSRSSNRVYLNADSLLLNLLGDTGVSKCVTLARTHARSHALARAHTHPAPRCAGASSSRARGAPSHPSHPCEGETPRGNASPVLLHLPSRARCRRRVGDAHKLGGARHSPTARG